MPGLSPDFHREDFVHEAFHEAYLALWYAIEHEGKSPERLISRWTGKKRTTVYAWRELGQLPRACDLWRLVHASSADGYDQVARKIVAQMFAFSIPGSVLVNNSFLDEIADLSECAGDLAKIERGGGSERALDVAADLRQIAGRVEAEARQTQSRLRRAQ